MTHETRPIGERLDPAAELRANAEGLKQFMDSFYAAKREQHDSLFGRPYGIEEQAADLMTLIQRLSVSIYQGLNSTAAALSTLRKDEDERA